MKSEPRFSMGNTYSSAKPALPTLNVSKAKHGSQDTPDDLYVGTGHPQRNVVPLSARHLPGSARKLPHTSTAQQQQQLVSPQVQESTAAGMDQPAPHRIVANNIVPALNMGAGSHHFAGSLSGSDQSLTARPAGHSSGPGSLPHVQQQQPRSTPQTSRPAYASPAAAPTAPPAADAVHTAPASVETGPITPAQALKRYGEYLTAFEQSEVLQYQQIWFLGKADVQKIKGNPHLQKTNYGYDDERGDYMVTVADHLAYRFEVQGVLGKGSFGQVLKVLDYKTGTYKALKIIRNKKRFHAQAQVELKVLQHLRHHDAEAAQNVIHIQEHFMFRNHLCITFELLSINLYEFIKQTNFQGLSLPLIKRFAQQMLVSLKFLKRHQLIHCDLKPENILLVQSQRSAIKVIDFGSSCFVDERMYTYVQSRFYRSPEVIMGLPYGCEIDMWSFSCILAELYMGYPLFPGEDEVEQLLCIMEIMGPPPRDLIDAASRRKVFFDASGAPNVVPNSRGKTRHPGTKSLWGVLRCKDPGFVDLLERCLRWDPAERLTPEQAMSHPWVVEAAATAAAQQQQGNRSVPNSSRTRGDQVPTGATVPSGGLLQPSSVLAAASAALAAAAAGFTGSAQPASSKAPVAGSMAGTSGAPPAGRVSGSQAGPLCSGQLGGSSAGSATGFAAAPISMAGAAAWQLDGLRQGSKTSSNGASSASGLPATHNLQHRSSGGGNDTSQSGLDSTPRAPHVAASSGSFSAAAPSVLAAAAGAPAHTPAAAGFAGSSSHGCPRAAGGADGVPPSGLNGANAAHHAAAVLASAPAAAMLPQLQQLQQQQSGAVLAGHQRRSSGGLDVLTTAGMRGQADQAALVAAHSLVKQQAGAVLSGAGAGAAGSGPPSPKKQQQHVHVVDAAMWAEQVAAEQQHQQDGGAAGGLSQQQIALFLVQQQQQQQQPISIVGQGIGLSSRQH